MFSSACRRASFAYVAGVGLDAAALDWATRVLAAGGTVSGATLAAVAAFSVSAKAAGYWDKLHRINLFCGNQLSAALVPLKVGSGSATETNTNFVAGDYTEATGITGNGTSKTLNTGVNPSTALTANDTHLAVYNRSSAESAGGATMGCYTGGGVAMFTLYAPLGSDGLFYSNQYNVGTGRVVSGAALGAPYGFCVGSRPSLAEHAIYRNGAAVNSNATNGGTLPNNANFLLFGLHDGASASSFSSSVLAGYSLGSGLTASQVAAYNIHMQAFQLALGRNV